MTPTFNSLLDLNQDLCSLENHFDVNVTDLDKFFVDTHPLQVAFSFPHRLWGREIYRILDSKLLFVFILHLTNRADPLMHIERYNGFTSEITDYVSQSIKL
jgi:hypothetical protein